MLNDYLDAHDTLGEDSALTKLGVAFSMTLGLNEQITKSVNELYTLREKEYQKLLNSDDTEGLKGYVSLFSAKHSKQLYQAFAICLIACKERNLDILQPLFKKGFNPLYRKLVSSTEFTRRDMISFLEKTKPFTAYEELERIAIYTTMIYITYHLKPGVVEDDFGESLVDTVEGFIANLYQIIITPYSVMDYKQTPVEMQESMQYLTKKYTANGRLNIQNIRNIILDEKIAKHPVMKNLIVEAQLTGKDIEGSKIDEVSEVIHKTLIEKDQTISLAHSMYSGMQFYIHTEFLYGAELDKEETQKLFYLTTLAYHIDNLKEHFTLETVLIIFSQLLKMQKETNHAADLYKKTLTEDVENKVVLKYENIVENLKTQLKVKTHESEKIAKEKAVLLERNKQAEQLLKDNEKELKRLHSLEAEFMRAKQENIALRNYSYQKAMEQEDKENDTIDELDMEAMLQEINAANLIIVGGNTNWQNKLKKMIPNALYMSIDKPGAFNSLSQAGKKVVINTMANTHANYYKMLKHVHTENDIYYYNNHVNTELSIQSLYNTLYNQV